MSLLLAVVDGAGHQHAVVLDKDDAYRVSVALNRERLRRANAGEVDNLGLRDALRTAILASAASDDTVPVWGPDDAATRHDLPAGDTEYGTSNIGVDAEYLDRKQVAILAGAGVRTVDRWISSGRLRSCKREGRRFINRTDLHEFLGG